METHRMSANARNLKRAKPRGSSLKSFAREVSLTGGHPLQADARGWIARKCGACGRQFGGAK